MNQCPRCHTLQEEAAAFFCSHCGFRFTDSIATSIPAKNPSTLWLTLNIIGSFFFFLSLFNVSIYFHAVGIVYAMHARFAYDEGNIQSCLAKTKKARMFFFIGSVSVAAGLLLSLIALALLVLILISIYN